MDNSLIEYLKDFLVKNELDGIIINSTNEYLIEYNLLSLNSRYYLTGFSGSAGDVLFTSDKIYQFADTRYHEQAEKQVDNSLVEVVKIPMSKSYLSALTELIPQYFKLGIISTKTPKSFYDLLVKTLQQKNSTVKLFDFDPVTEYKKDSIPQINYNVFKVPDEISGVSADEKFKTIKEFAGDNYNLVITSLADIAYLTNLRSYDFAYNSVFPAKAIVTDREAVIYSDCKLPYIGEYFTQRSAQEFAADLKNIQNKTLYIDEKELTINDYNLINKTNRVKTSRFALLKTVKNDNEIKHLKECFKRSDNALKVLYEMINSEKIYSEYEYSQALEKAMKDNGALALSFKPIVAGGANTSVVHYTTPSKEKMIQDGDFLLVDFGGYYEGGMATDTTRTFIKGEPSAEQKTAYTAVLKAYLNAYYNKYPKKSAYKDIDKIARETIEKSVSEDYKFSHSTGHGVGISVHERPPVVSSSDISNTKIIENTVFSIEPGVYKEGWGGIRLENTVYAHKNEDKTEMHAFSHFPFEIKLVDLSMMNDYEKYYYMKWQAQACEL